MVIIAPRGLHRVQYDRQFTGGSQGIRQGWKLLRTAGATVREMLIDASAKQWNVPGKNLQRK